MRTSKIKPKGTGTLQFSFLRRVDFSNDRNSITDISFDIASTYLTNGSGNDIHGELVSANGKYKYQITGTFNPKELNFDIQIFDKTNY